jgi:hypothetical protein
MAITTTWKVDIGTQAAPTDFTSRVMSMSISQQVDVNEVGRGQCIITLLNKDGALTPGGGGTYSSTDWFAQGVYVNASTNTGAGATSTDVFDGVIVDFDLVDNGVYSTVTITALDGLTVAAKTVGSQIGVFSTKSYKNVYDQLVDRTGIVFPRLGRTDAEGIVSYEWAASTWQLTQFSSDTIYPSTYADALQTYAIPSVSDVTWPTNITATGTVANYNIISLGFNSTRSSANRVTYTFDPAGSISGTDLPFDDDDFQQAFNNDTLITQAQVKAVSTGATTQTSTNSTNTTYGNRTVQYLAVLTESDTKSLDQAKLLTNRYGTSRFNPVNIRTTASMVKARAADAAETTWRNLLGIATGIWQRTVITWQGSGASSQTAYCVIKGRQINVTPQDTVVTLILGNWADNHGFILDTDQLNIDRLGYQ